VDPYTAHERRRRSSLFHDIDTLQKLGEKFNPSSKEKEKEKGRREEEAANLKEEVVKLRGDFNKKAREDELKEAVSSAKAEGVKVGEESERQRRKRESGAALAMGLGFGGWGPQLGGGMEVDGDVKLHLHRHVLDGGRGDGGLGLAERDDLDVGRRALVDPSYAGGGARMMLDRVRNVEARQNELDMEFQRGREREREREGLRISRWRYP
jgi:hypothetical protein